jgi:hypothetical protein
MRKIRGFQFFQIDVKAKNRRALGMKLTILTLGIGKDYCRNLAKALDSKKAYAEKHGYTYIQGGEEFWDRERPISWSKVPFLLHHLNKLPDKEWVWLSDADVYITNPNLKFEEHVMPLFDGHPGKYMMMALDACGNVNAGNIVLQNTQWMRDFWKRVYEQTDVIYHIWWENAGILKLLGKNEIDRDNVLITPEHKRFNAYLMGLDNQPKWEQGDFLVHFAGVYDSKKMKELMDDIDAGKTPRLAMT